MWFPEGTGGYEVLRSELELTLPCCVLRCLCHMCVSLAQINHKYPERRLLVAEACGALAPYLPVRDSIPLNIKLGHINHVHLSTVSQLVIVKTLDVQDHCGEW